MKLVSYRIARKSQIGFVYKDRVYDLQALDNRFPATMQAFLREWDFYLDLARKAEIKVSESYVLQSRGIPLASVNLDAPVPKPASLRDGYTFRAHVAAARKNRGLEMISAFDEYPVFYYGNHTNIFGPGMIKCQPDHMNRLDFELEVAIVIAKKGKNIRAGVADEYIAGLMIMNDFSARTLQMEEMMLNLGPAKGKDFATCLGPWLLTTDELKPFEVSPKENHTGKSWNLTMTASLNGEQISEGNLADMDWTFAELIERASYAVELQPGDVIGSGTVGTGCLLELNGSRSEQRWLLEGDEISLSVGGLGELKNLIAHSAVDYSILELKKKDRVMILDMSRLSPSDKQSWLLSAVAPRPVALASTINRNGEVNLSPFSFFNVFSSEPPIVIFSPALRLRDGTRKHTLDNIHEVMEVAISIADFGMLEKVNTASAEYPKGVNEFEKAGFTQKQSTMIRPPFIGEARVSMECKVLEIKSLGKNGGAGNLIICEVLLMHVDPTLIDQEGHISPIDFEQIARLGGDWYARMGSPVLFKLSKPRKP